MKELKLKCNSYRLTSREHQVLSLLIKGMTIHKVAEILFVSYHTIISHKKSIMKKFGAKNGIHLGALAVHIGDNEGEAQNN